MPVTNQCLKILLDKREGEAIDCIEEDPQYVTFDDPKVIIINIVAFIQLLCTS